MFNIAEIWTSSRRTPKYRLVLSLLTLVAGLAVSRPGIAQDIQVTSPIGSLGSSSAVWVRAHNVGCGGQTPVAFGYSIDNESALYRGTAYDIDTTNSTISTGTHTIHFKSWTRSGICPVVNESFTVGSGSGPDITVADPISGGTASSPVWVRAHNVGCNGLLPVAFGYSIDNQSTFYPGVTPYDISVTNQAMTAGNHTVHFKSWTRGGLCPVVNAMLTVSGTVTPVAIVESTPTMVTASVASSSVTTLDAIPSNAISSGNLDSLTNWEYSHDYVTRGTSNGSTLYPTNTPSFDTARGFYVNYTYGGGEIYHVSFANDAAATHFVYDTYVYLADPSQVENVEMDMNQVMGNGDTVIFGTQCSGYSRTWEFTTTSNGSPHWSQSNLPCNPQSWAADTWHHVQIASHRDNYGVVTYDWVNLDGVHSNFQNATGTSSLSLAWQKGDILINFQLDGDNVSEGSITAFLHNTTVYRW